MPNYCENQLHFDCSKEEFENIIRPMLSGLDQNGEQQALTFNTLVPMPDDIYRGDLGPEERRQYGQRNWFDWCNANWGTKWDAWDARVEWECVAFTTAWDTPWPWYEALAKKLDEHGITAHADYFVEGGFPGSLGGIDLEDGVCYNTEADEEFAEIWTCDENEEEEE